MLIEQGFQRISEHTYSIGIQQDTLCKFLFIAQHGKVALLAIAERTTIRHHTNSKSFILVRHMKVERHFTRFASLHHKRALLRQDDLFGFGQEKFHPCRTLHFLTGKIDEGSCHIYLIAHTDETG